MFKGFGKPKEPSIDELCTGSLELYEDIKQYAESEPDTRALLAQCVMKFAQSDGHEVNEVRLTWGRICVATACHSIMQKLKDEGAGEELSLFQVLHYIKATSLEDLAAMGL